MTDVQLYLSMGVPMLFNGLLFTMLVLHINSRFEAQDKVFSEKLRRVEEVLDAG